MKNILACLAVLAAFNISAQGVYTYPQWNPDANYSGFIESSDLLSMLTVFSQPWGFNDSAFCIYDGTEFESFMTDAIAGDIVIDSISVQFILSDNTDPYYVPGCPDPLTDSVETFYSFMLQRTSNSNYEGDGFRFRMLFDSQNGLYNFRIGWTSGWGNGPLDLVEEGLYGASTYSASYPFVARPHGNNWISLPFAQHMSPDLDSTGVVFTEVPSDTWDLQRYGWHEDYTLSNTVTDCWADYITHWNMIPFWHYAE